MFVTKKSDYRPKNWNFEQAKAQSFQLARAAAEDWYNSIFVEGYLADYWAANKFGGQTCTCRATELGNRDYPTADDDDQDLQHTIQDQIEKNTKVKDNRITSFKVSGDDRMFGASPNDIASDAQDISEFLVNEDQDSLGLQNFLDNEFESGADCAICYRLGSQPGYEKSGCHRLVMTSLNIFDTFSAFVNKQTSPHQIEVEEDGWVCYELTVPRYWNSVTASLYSGHDQFESCGGIWIDQGAINPITRAWLETKRGQTVHIWISRVDIFTHVVFQFEIGSQPIRLSLPQLQKMRDYTRFITIPVTRIIVDNTVPVASIHDIISCPQLNLMWKITEVNPLTLLDDYQVGWELQGRLIQPTEGLNSIRPDSSSVLISKPTDPPPPLLPFYLVGNLANYGYDQQSYISSCSIAEGRGPFVISFSSLPTGLSASINGRTLTVSGTLNTSPSDPSQIPLSLTVRDTFNLQEVPISLNLNRYPVLQIAASFENAVVGTSYAEILSAVGGATPITWSYDPPVSGMSLTVISSNTASFSGTPISIGSTALSFTARDSNGATRVFVTTWTVVAVPPAPPSTTGDLNYTHVQNIAASVWTITHNLNKYPAVGVEDSSGQPIIGAVEHLSINQLTITFSSAVAGQAFLN